MKTLLASLAMLAAAAATTPQAPVGYRFDDVKRTVVLKTAANQESPASKGLRAQSGDRVHTGLFSYALIAAEQHRARFEIFGSTDVQLAGGTPGVILSLERGRIHALFDKITGSEPRIVQTPGALLAVRGTQYNVEVDAAGQATLDVFEGIVEIRSPLRPEPFLVRAGESSNFSRRMPPPDHPMQTPPSRRQGAPDPHDGGDQHGGQPAAHPGDPGAHGGQPPPQQPQPRPAPPPPPPGGHH